MLIIICHIVPPDCELFEIACCHEQVSTSAFINEYQQNGTLSTMLAVLDAFNVTQIYITYNRTCLLKQVPYLIT